MCDSLHQPATYEMQHVWRYNDIMIHVYHIGIQWHCSAYSFINNRCL